MYLSQCNTTPTYLHFICGLGSGLESSLVQLLFSSSFTTEPEQQKKLAGVTAALAAHLETIFRTIWIFRIQ